MDGWCRRGVGKPHHREVLSQSCLTDRGHKGVIDAKGFGWPVRPLLILAEPAPSTLRRAVDRRMSDRRSEPERAHASVDGLGICCIDDVGLVPVAECLVPARLCHQVAPGTEVGLAVIVSEGVLNISL